MRPINSGGGRPGRQNRDHYALTDVAQVHIAVAGLHTLRQMLRESEQ
jgi:hypothetical protein